MSGVISWVITAFFSLPFWLSRQSLPFQNSFIFVLCQISHPVNGQPNSGRGTERLQKPGRRYGTGRAQGFVLKILCGEREASIPLEFLRVDKIAEVLESPCLPLLVEVRVLSSKTVEWEDNPFSLQVIK